MLIGAWQIALPFVQPVTDVTNLALPIGLLALAAVWMFGRVRGSAAQVSSGRVAGTIAALGMAGTLLLGGAFSDSAHAAELSDPSDAPAPIETVTPSRPVTPVTVKDAGLVERELIVHGFRAPSMGVELRDGWLGFHLGLYPTPIDNNAEGKTLTNWFFKTGVTL